MNTTVKRGIDSISASQRLSASPGCSFSASTAYCPLPTAYWFFYDGWNLLPETINNQTSTITNRFTWGLDLSGSLQGAGGIRLHDIPAGQVRLHDIPAGQVGGLLAILPPDSCLLSPVFDANGNVSEVLEGGAGTPSSRILAHYEYSSFGETITATGPLAKENPYRFSTKYTDDETKLVYYGYRFYNPDLGRWMNRDPIEEQGFSELRHVYYTKYFPVIKKPCATWGFPENERRVFEGYAPCGTSYCGFK